MSAFLGTSIVICVAILINKQSLSLGWRVVVATSIALSVFLILKSQSIQGLLFAYLGLLTMAYLNFKSDFKMRLLIQSFTIISASIGILGLLNRGLLAEYLYAPSISARGDYWRAAVQMSRDFPFFGVGIEKFGEFFSQYRDLQQVQGRNWATYSDNAHNVFLQIASTSGLFTAFSLVLLHLLVWGKAISRIRASDSIEENKSLIALLSISVASSTPMLISVDNIGMAVLSWFNLGLLYCGTRHSAHNDNETLFRNKSSYVVSSFTSFSLLIVLTVLVLYPVAKADLEFTQYMKQSTSSSFNMVQQDTFFNSVNKLRPSEYRYQVLFARKYSEMGNLKKSREIYLELTENSPNSAEIFRMIAQTFEAEGNTSKELEFRVKSQQLDFYRMDNLLSIVKGYAKLGKEEEALKYFNIMKEALPQYPYTNEAQQIILESFPDR
jgi:pentatricopeptide repeat protein